MSELRIDIAFDGDIATCTFRRPPANAIDSLMLDEIERACDTVLARPNCAAMILTGTERFFSAGLDLKAVTSYSPKEFRSFVMRLSSVICRFYDVDVPTIAAINGHAVAGGLIFALCCDQRIAASGNYRLSLSEVTVGIPFPIAAIEVVRTELSRQAARLAAQHALPFTPGEAHRLGIVDIVCEADALGSTAQAEAARVAKLDKSCFLNTRRQLRASALTAMRNAIESGHDPMFDKLDPAVLARRAAALVK